MNLQVKMIPNTARSLTIHLSRIIPKTLVEVERCPSSSSNEVEDKLEEFALSLSSISPDAEFASSEIEDKLDEFASGEVEDKFDELASRNKVR